MKTKSASLTQPGKFEFIEEDLHINDNQVLIKIEACGLCTWELYHFQGKYGFPQRLGHEPSGTVVERGKNVNSLSVGDRVTGYFGPGFATYAVASPSNVIKIPNELKTEYALGEPLACVTNIVRTANPEFGDYVLFLGCGFMNLLALSGLASKGLGGLIAVDVWDSRLELAEEFGATVTLNSKRVDVTEEVKKATQGRGVDIVLEAAAKPGILDLASRLLKDKRGKLLLVTSHSGNESVNVGLWSERGTIVLSPHPSYSLDLMDDLRRAVDGLARAVFPMEKLLTHRFRLADIQEAFDTYSKKPEDYIKGIVVP